MGNKSPAELTARISYLEKVIESLPYGICVLDAQGKVVMMNRVQEAHSKISREKVLGHYFHELWKDLLSRTEIGAHYWPLLHEKKPFEIVFHDVYPQFYDVKISGLLLGAPLPDDEGIMIMAHISNKIREDKHALSLLANNLAESRAFLQNLVDSSPSAIFTVSVDNTIRSSNRTATEIFGYAKGDLLWRPVSLLFAGGVKVKELAAQSSIESGIEVICQKQNGDVFPARLQLSKVRNKQGTVTERLFIITDISREKYMEERLAISEKLAIYSELIAGIFHQINNPLVGVVNFSTLLLERMDEHDPNKTIVETMHKAARQCQNLISIMVKGFREPQSTFSRIHLRELLDHAVDETVRNLPEGPAKVAVVRRIGARLPKIMGDALQLSQVFKNLMDNAVQSMPHGGKLQVFTAVDKPSGHVHIHFSDTGCGIPKENLNMIFTPFFSTKKNTGGGLGLSFAHRVINNHHGRIDVASSLDHGSTFTVVLPVAEKDPKRKADVHS